MAFQTRDVLQAMEHDTGLPLPSLKVDGGASVNDRLMQFQSDILSVPVQRPVVSETTALGAAYLAGLAVGYWQGLDELRGLWELGREYVPAMADPERTVPLRAMARGAAAGAGLGSPAARDALSVC